MYNSLAMGRHEHRRRRSGDKEHEIVRREADGDARILRRSCSPRFRWRSRPGREAGGDPPDPEADSQAAMKDKVHDPRVEKSQKGGSDWGMWDIGRPHPMQGKGEFGGHDAIGVAAGKLITPIARSIGTIQTRTKSCASHRRPRSSISSMHRGPTRPAPKSAGAR